MKKRLRLSEVANSIVVSKVLQERSKSEMCDEESSMHDYADDRMLAEEYLMWVHNNMSDDEVNHED